MAAQQEKQQLQQRLQSSNQQQSNGMDKHWVLELQKQVRDGPYWISGGQATDKTTAQQMITLAAQSTVNQRVKKPASPCTSNTEGPLD